nr:hypothetical protein [Tanacetum cinerariifolium]
FLLLLFNSSANFWQWHLFSSGSGNNLHWQLELILPVGTLTWQWECLVHFIPNKVLVTTATVTITGFYTITIAILKDIMKEQQQLYRVLMKNKLRLQL